MKDLNILELWFVTGSQHLYGTKALAQVAANSKEVAAELDEPLPNLPVARALWKPQPDFKTSAASWICSGGSHHPVFSKSVNSEIMEDFVSMAGIELVHINRESTVSGVRKELKNNEVFYHSSKGFSFAG